jgi:hypothetical protein
MIANSETAKKLAQKILGTDNKGFLIVVFPEGKRTLRARDISLATNAENDGVLIDVIALAAMMIAAGHYQQEIIGEEQHQLPE